MGAKTLAIIFTGVLVILFTKVESNDELTKKLVFAAAKQYQQQYPNYYGNYGKNYYGKVARDGLSESPPPEVGTGSYDTIGSSSIGGYGTPQQQMYQYKIIPTGSSYASSYTPSNYVEEEEYEEGGNSSAGGSEICIAALLGYKGAKGVKAAKALKAIKAIKALKILLPLALGPILPLILGIVFLPLLLIGILLFFPVVVLPTGRDGGLTNFTSRVLDNVLSSNQCVERISCEIGQVAKEYNGLKKIQIIIGKGSSGLRGRIGRGLESFGSCNKFSCSPLNFFRSNKAEEKNEHSMKPKLVFSQKMKS